MKATEPQGAPTRQHRSAEGSTAAHEQETTFFPDPTRETTPFFRASFLDAGRVGPGLDRAPFFQSAGAPLLRSRPAPVPTIHRMPAFESESEPAPEGGPLLQRVPIFESGAGANGEQSLLQRKETEAEVEDDVARENDRRAGHNGSASAPDDGDGSAAAAQPLLQARLTIGRPNDRFEREADAVADQVVNMPRHPGGTATGVQAKPLPITELPRPHQQPSGLPRPTRAPHDRVQRQESDGPTASADVASRLGSRRGGGRGLEEGTRLEMESAIGADFSGVRVHTDGEATQLSQDLGAKAFTHGSDIYFNEGQYDPDSSGGKHLLAHELTHTVQQGASIRRKVAVSVGGAPAIQRLPGFIKRGVNWLAERIIPGYTLLNVILGKNIITGDAVARSGVNLIRGYMRLSPVIGSILLSQLEETETLPEAGRWVEGKVAEFGIDFNDIARRLRLMWDEMSVWKGVEGNVKVFKKHLGPVIGKGHWPPCFLSRGQAS